MEDNRIQFLCELPHAANLQQLCDLAFRILGNPVFISDLAHTILAYTQCVEVEDPTWQENVVHSVLESNTLRQEREVSAIHGRSSDGHKAVLVKDSYMPYPRYIKTLVGKGQQAMGVMVTTAYFRPFQPEDAELIDLIASFVLPMLTDRHYKLTGSRQTVEHLLLRLLEGRRFHREELKDRLDALGFRSHPHMYVLSIGLGHEEVPNSLPGLEQLIDSFLLLGSCRVVVFNTTIVCLYGSEEDITDWETQAPELHSLLQRETLLAGISREVQAIEDLQEYYRQAQTALEIGVRLGRLDRFFLYDALSAFSLFQQIPREELPLYCHQKIQTLGAYDQTHGTELCVTLQVYLEQAKSLARTAEILFIHRNTVRYRIKKCMELMNSDLEDGNDIFAYILSLRILEYHRKFPTGADERPA